MKVINIHEAKTHFSKLVETAAAGKELIIGKAGKPLAKLVPFAAGVLPDKIGGQLKGKIKFAPDCWELDEEIAALLTGGPISPETGETSLRVVGDSPKRGKSK